MGFGANETGYDDVYILTIPTFTWVKVYPAKGKPRKKSEEFPHYDLTCSVVRNAQMLVIGGQFPRDPDVKNVPLSSALLACVDRLGPTNFEDC